MPLLTFFGLVKCQNTLERRQNWEEIIVAQLRRMVVFLLSNMGAGISKESQAIKMSQNPGCHLAPAMKYFDALLQRPFGLWSSIGRKQTGDYALHHCSR